MDKWLEKAKSAVRCHAKTAPCSICSDLLRDERVAFFYGTDGRNGKARFKDCKFFFHKQHNSPSRYNEKLCTFCAHLEVERLVPACENYLTGSKFQSVKIKVLLDPLTDMQTRRNNCLLCALITGMISREGETDSRHWALLEITSQICNFSSRESHLQIVLIGEKAECRLIAELFYDSKEYWEKKLGLYNGQAPLLEPSVKGIDWQMVKGWIEENPKRPTFKKPPVDFRLIDVDERRVAQVTELQDYVCLSYVWGTDTSFQTTFETIDDLGKPNSLAGSEVPRTIRHAMRACAALGKRYLWVERLCIIQDEEENPSKQTQIDAMGEIYGSAWLTIVAIEGTSADYGLHGVSPSLERVPSYQIYLGGEGLSEKIPSLSSICNDRMWTTRGWTYQEAILSPRLLFFTKHGLFYEHDNFARGWDNRTKNDIQSWIYELNSPQFHSLSQSLPLRYLYVASKITQREFGHEGDIVNGFAGILDFILGKGNHRFAMPLTELPSAICWKPSSGHQNLGGRRQPRGSTAFPSWS